MTDTLLTEAPASQTKTSMGVDPIGQVERAQGLFEKGPITAVAAFFAVAFFVALYLLLREKDKHSAEMSSLHTSERERAVKHEVTMSNYLDMMDDVRFIAFEMRRVKQAREKRHRSDEDEGNNGDPDA